MATPYIGEIRMFAGNFAPYGWFLCQGQILPISQYDVLFNLIGTTYGGDGQSTFALPDLRSRAPLHVGQGQGTSNYTIGQNGGVESVTLAANQIPVHNHSINVNDAQGNNGKAGGNVLATTSGNTNVYSTNAPAEAMNSGALTNTGGSQPHDNVQPYLAINFIIAWTGLYPSQT